MKKTLILLCIFALLLPLASLGAQAKETEPLPFDLTCASAVLMESSTGKILYAKNAEAALPPASVTKVMTLLLVMEAVRDGKVAWGDPVTVSERDAYGCSCKFRCSSK